MQARDPEEIARDNLSVEMTDAFESRTLTLNHLLMQKHIDKLNQETAILQEQGNQLQKQNNKLQRIIIWLAVAATVTGLIQISMLIWPPRSAPPTPIQEQNTSRAINPVPASSGEVVPPSKTMPPQTTSQTPRRDTSVGSGTPSQSTYKDQKPTQSPPYEKKK
jgi:hypothetical protein